MSETDLQNGFDWSPLGREWWIATGAGLRPPVRDDRQLKFASAIVRGEKIKRAGELAGYGSEASIRSVSSKVNQTKTVRELVELGKEALALREAGEAEPVRRPFDLMRRREILEAIADNPNKDDVTRMRAIEQLGKLEGGAEFGQPPDDDGLSEWRSVRDMLRLPGGAVAILSLWCGRGCGLPSIPLLHDVHAMAMREDPDMWARIYAKHNFRDQHEVSRCVANSKWQRGARERIWGEVGWVVPEKGPAIPDPQGRSFVAPTTPLPTWHDADDDPEDRSEANGNGHASHAPAPNEHSAVESVDGRAMRDAEMAGAREDQ